MAIDQSKIGRTVAEQMQAIEDVVGNIEVTVHSSISLVILEDEEGNTDIRVRASEGCAPLTAAAALMTGAQLMIVQERQNQERSEE